MDVIKEKKGLVQKALNLENNPCSTKTITDSIQNQNINFGSDNKKPNIKQEIKMAISDEIQDQIQSQQQQQLIEMPNSQQQQQQQQQQIPFNNNNRQQKMHLETSVDKNLNFFSIDGEDEKNQEKNYDSIQMEYQNDDTQYSNVFNLEGESEKTSKRKPDKPRVSKRNIVQTNPQETDNDYEKVKN